MNLALTIIDDLYDFVLRTTCTIVTYGRRSFTETPVTSEPEVVVEPEVPLPVAEVSVPEISETPTFTQVSDIIKSVHEQRPHRAEPAAAIFPERNTVMYATVAHTPVFKHPAFEYDSVVAHLSFGDMVIVLESVGRWSKISWGTHEGWVIRDLVVPQAGEVYPQFLVGTAYHVTDEGAQKLRAVIKDAFGCGAAELPLQSGEYVTYRLLRKGITIPWSDVRPRTPGSWHMLLRGQLGVHIGVIPKTGSIFEYTQREIGHVAYIESVLPDNTIMLSEANFPDNGIYNERTLKETEWKELAPVFIQLS